MEKFQGWTPATVDNLTFDQLGAIFEELARRHGGRKDKEFKIKGIPSVKMTRDEINKWVKAGCPSLLEKKKLSKRKRR